MGQVLRFCFIGWLVGQFCFCFWRGRSKKQDGGYSWSNGAREVFVVVLVGKCLYFLRE